MYLRMHADIHSACMRTFVHAYMYDMHILCLAYTRLWRVCRRLHFLFCFPPRKTAVCDRQRWKKESGKNLEAHHI